MISTTQIARELPRKGIDEDISVGLVNLGNYT